MENTTENTSLQDSVAGKLQVLAQRRQMIEGLLASLNELDNELATLGKTEEAADNEAADARAKSKELLSSNLGHLSKEVYDLKAEERAAYSLAEDLRAIRFDIETQRLKQTLEISDAAKDFYAVFNAAKKEMADLAEARLLASIPEDFVEAIVMRAAIEECDARSEWRSVMGNWHKDALEFAASALLKKLLNQVRQRKDWKVFPEELSAGLDLSGTPSLSPLQRQEYVQNIAVREAQGYQP